MASVKKNMTTPQQLHIPVLLDKVLELLDPKQGETYLDLTAGYGGHAKAVIARIGSASQATLVDRDDFAINALIDLKEQGTRLIQSDYLAAAKNLVNESERFNMILLDLGVSSPQLDMVERGFSFRFDAPLDMRMDRSQKLTAADIVNRASEKELAQIIQNYGEESPRLAGKIAAKIVRRRAKQAFVRTADLAEVVASTSSHWTKIHPATRTFQALRIVTNDELGQLTDVLPLTVKLLKPGGRLAVISFHSLEDRIVKRFFSEQAESGYEAELEILTKHPVSGTEDVNNPRSRSAKLRVAAKINKRKDL